MQTSTPVRHTGTRSDNQHDDGVEVSSVVFRISVFESPSFKDGYGLSLKRSNINFLAAPIEPFFGAMTVPTDVKYDPDDTHYAFSFLCDKACHL